MSSSWELICHHTYAGTPGVVVDLSPSRRSHASVSGLGDDDFLADGAEAGSGAVSIFDPAARIDIADSESWRPIRGLAVEMRILLEPGASGQRVLLDSPSFRFYVTSEVLFARFRNHSLQETEVSTHLDLVVPSSFQLPIGVWTVLGFMHDGVSLMELSVDGEVVARRPGVLNGLASPGAAGVTVGNAAAGSHAMNGQLDELRVWRLDPQRVQHDFFERPMNERAANCLADFDRALAAAFARHPDCAPRMRKEIRASLGQLVRKAMNAAPDARARLLILAEKYHELWRAGRLAGSAMNDVLAHAAALLDELGVSVQNDPVLMGLAKDPCYQQVISELPSLDCDPQLTGLLRALASRLEAQSSNRRRE